MSTAKRGELVRGGNTWNQESTVEERFEYVIELTHPEDGEKWLRATGGDWGPDYLPTADLREAERFGTREDAERVRRECNWSHDNLRDLRVTKVHVREELQVVT